MMTVRDLINKLKEVAEKHGDDCQMVAFEDGTEYGVVGVSVEKVYIALIY